MKTKKYVIALALVGGMLFLAQAVNSYSANGQEIAKIDKKKRELPSK